MADLIRGIAPQIDTHDNWVAANPTLGKDADGKSYGQIIFATGSPVGNILVYGNDQTYNVAYAAGQYLLAGITATETEVNQAADWSARTKTLSADYTILDDDGYETFLATTGASDLDIDIPTAADNVGRTIYIKKVDSGAGKVTLTFEAGEDEAGVSRLVGDGGYIELVSNGTDWHIKDHYDRYSTGWVANSTWEAAELTASHNLDEDLSNLIVKFFLSTDGTEANSFEVYSLTRIVDTGTGNNEYYGITLLPVDYSSFYAQTGLTGLAYIRDNGAWQKIIDGDTFYYKIVVYSKQI